jgi:6-phosphogluconolactonase (cycloisomerase 2 family)
MALSRDGLLLVVANEHANTVAAFSVDTVSGLLSPLDVYAGGLLGPTMVAFVNDG